MIVNIINQKKGRRNVCITALFLLLLSTRFFDLIILPYRFFLCIGFVVLLYFYLTTKEDTYHYKRWIGLLEVMILGSVFFSKIVHKQSFVDVFFASYFAFGLASFFIFRKLQLSYKQSEKLVKVFSVAFCLCYIIQWLVHPIEIFAGVLDEFSVSEKGFRMRMTCSACSYCLFFLGLSEYVQKNKIIGLVYSFLGFIPFLIMGFRSLISLTIVFAIYLIIVSIWKKKKSKILLYFVFIGIIVVGLLQLPIVQDKIDEMQDRQEKEQTFDNKDYIRYASLAFYQDMYNSTAERFFGGGFPLVKKSLMSNNYYVSRISYGYGFGFFWNDLGLIGFGFIFGFPSVFVLSFLVFRTIIKCREKPLLFIRSTLLTIYIGTIFTSQELYRAGNFIFIGLLMYVEYIYHQEKNENRNTNISQRL